MALMSKSSGSEIDENGGQIDGPSENVVAEHPEQKQQKKKKKFVGKIARIRKEFEVTKQLCTITKLKNRALKAELNEQKMMSERNELKAKIDKLEKQKTKLKTDANHLVNSIQNKIADLEKQQNKLENFVAILKDRFGNELLKAVHPTIRPTIVEKFLNFQNQKNCWNSIACHSNLTVFGNENSMVQYKKDGNVWASVFAKSAMPNSEFGIIYYEMKVLNLKSLLTIGMATKAMPLNEIVGENVESFGFRSDGTFWVDNFCVNNENVKICRGDIVGCGVNLATRRIIFTKNGICLDTSDLFISSSHSADHLLFPCVSLGDCGDLIDANFGPNFKFDPANLKTKRFFKNYLDKNVCNKNIIISGDDSLTAHCATEKGRYADSFNVFAKYSVLNTVNSTDDGICYFEVTIIHGQPIIGFAAKEFSSLDLYKRGHGIYAFEGENGDFWFNGCQKEQGEKVGIGDVIGCGINLANRHIFFTKNGHRIESEDNHRVLSIYGDDGNPLFPFVSLWYKGNKIKANFGPKFKFDLSKLCSDENDRKIE